jgi:hypothetical protein
MPALLQKTDFILIICLESLILIFSFLPRDKRKEINIKDYMIENQSDSTLGRVPGQVSGQQFVIQNCKVAHFSLNLDFLERTLICEYN